LEKQKTIVKDSDQLTDKGRQRFNVGEERGRGQKP
jgi:hypothetical protein